MIIDKKLNVTNDVMTFIFKSSLTSIPNFKNWYSDPSMIGRHFLIHENSQAQIKRQYTVCSSMRPEIQQEVIQAAKCVIDGG